LKEIIIDIVAALGAIIFSCGVFLEFGLGFSLISLGSFMFLLSLLSAKAQGNLNVFDS